MDSKKIVLPSPERKALHKRAGASQLLDGDAVYIRDLPFEEMSDDALRQLTLMADSVFKSFDLVLGGLAELVSRGLVPENAGTLYFDHLPSDVKAA